MLINASHPLGRTSPETHCLQPVNHTACATVLCVRVIMCLTLQLYSWLNSKRKPRPFACSVLQTLKGRFYMCRRKLGLIDDRRWEMFESKQARMEADKKRLATTRIQPDSDLAKVFAEVSGQNVNTVHPLNHTVAACFQKLRHSRA
jgi:hypothetical protein